MDSRILHQMAACNIFLYPSKISKWFELQRSFAIATVMILFLHKAIAQQPVPALQEEMYKGKVLAATDTSSILAAFKRGHVNGHFRYFFMSTQNEKGLTDYFANAAGGGLRYETAKFHGFQFGVSGFYTYNIGSSNLAKPDSITGQSNRYELGLFDIESPENKNDMNRLEELFVKYTFRHSSITVGKQLLNTAFVNLQDSRMRPTGVNGIWFELNEVKKVSFAGGWIYSISPRSTTRWFGTAESIGVYPGGVNVDGSKSGYKGKLQSKGLFMLSAHAALSAHVKLHGWNMLVANIFNTAMLQTDVVVPLQQGRHLFASIQLIRQDAVANGGNSNAVQTYFEKGGKSMVFGLKAGWKNTRWETSLNFNRITSAGRFLVPREWGVEPFFTYLSRERNEGLGDVTAVMARVNYQVPGARLKSSLAAGYYQLPDVKNYRLNKYGVPSYLHLRAELLYAFAGGLEGLDVQMLVVGKVREGDTYDNKRYEFNKVNLVQYNLVMNFHF